MLHNDVDFFPRDTAVLEPKGNTIQQSQWLQNSDEQQLLALLSSRKGNYRHNGKQRITTSLLLETMSQWRILTKKLEGTPEERNISETR